MTQAHEAAPPEQSHVDEVVRRAMRSTARTLDTAVRVFSREDGESLLVHADELESLERVLTDALLVIGKSPNLSILAAAQLFQCVGAIRYALNARRAGNTALELTFDNHCALAFVEIFTVAMRALARAEERA